MESPPPPAIDERDLIGVLAGSWGLEAVGLRYEPKGFGSYHWVGGSGDGRRWFVKLDALEGKPYLGDDPRSALDGLAAAYGTARRLAETGLGFVVAPVPTRAGPILHPLDEGWALSVYPFVDGETGEWGQPGPPERRRQLALTLARLHSAPPSVGGAVRPLRWELPGRAGLEAALDDLGSPWSGGPFSEPVRLALRASLTLVRGWLATLDALASEVAALDLEPVVTHGEPHPGNVMTAEGDLRLIDWDTVALAPAERDLWMLGPDGEAVGAYEVASGRALEPPAMAFYRLTWALTDVALFTDALRGDHGRDRVTEKSWTGLRGILAGSEPAPYGPIGAPR